MKSINAKDLNIHGKGFVNAKDFTRLEPEDLATMTRIFPKYSVNMDLEAFPRIGNNSAGLHIDFKTDSRNITLKWTTEYRNRFESMAFYNESGLDLYIMINGKYRFLGAACPNTKEKHSVWDIVTEKFKNIPEGMNQYTLNLCMYDQCSHLEICIDDNAKIEPVPLKKDYIAIYGSSITQGGCASRPGRTFTHILRMNLDEEIVNMGFSGGGLLQPEMTDILMKLSPKIMVMDCVANMAAALNDENYIYNWNYFYIKFREKFPNVPLVIIEQPTFTDSWTFLDSLEPKNLLLRDIVKSWNDKNLSYIKGDNLYGDDFEASVEGTHPTDLGFARMVEIIQPVLEKYL